MSVDSKKIELFKNLSEFDIDDLYFDFHNDFDCINIKFDSCFLIFIFQNIADNSLVSIQFENAILTYCEFNFQETVNVLTIDNLYRGKFENKGELIEFQNNCGYFYLEFYEGQKMEFWSEGVTVKKIE